MTRQVLYFSVGTKCITRMLISAFTLRQHYSGPVTLMTCGPQPEMFLTLMKRLNVDIQPIDADPKLHPLVIKASLWKYVKYDASMFLDADTLVFKPIDTYFEMIEKHTFCTGAFSTWRTDAKGTISKRIRNFSKVCPPEYIEDAIQFGPAVNTGIHGYLKGAPILKEWEELTAKGYDAGCSVIPDEIACQILLPRYPHWVAPVEWGVSVKYGKMDDTSIIGHLHGRKHTNIWPMCGLWKTTFWKYLATLSKEEKDFMIDTQGDRKLAHYLGTVPKDVTGVTAVDEKYLPLLQKNFPVWMKTEGVMELPFICFVNGMKLDDPRLDFLDGRVQRIAWDFPADSQREKMLSAFVFGAARHVTTPKWVKIDADAFMKYTENEGVTYKIPVEWYSGNFSITAHKWHYTKPGKFLVDLEKWSSCVNDLASKPRIFPEAQWPEIEAARRFGHARFASYFCVHDSSFVKYAASLAGSKLPVNSHDTYFWFITEKLNLPTRRIKLKKWIAA